MPPTVAAFIRTQGLICAVLNAVLNPLLAWTLQPPETSRAALMVDTAITCVVMSLLVSLFTSAGVGQARRAGTLPPLGEPRPLLGQLPRAPWALGLALGLAAACAAVPLASGLLYSLDLAPLTPAEVALFKFLYTPPLGYLITRLVVSRTLLQEPG